MGEWLNLEFNKHRKFRWAFKTIYKQYIRNVLMYISFFSIYYLTLKKKKKKKKKENIAGWMKDDVLKKMSGAKIRLKTTSGSRTLNAAVH